MTRKLYNVAVPTGQYTDKTGNTRANWETVGAMFQKDDGKKFITIKRTFNPAGVNTDGNSASVILSLFEPRENER